MPNFNSASDYYREKYGERIQKIPVNAGFSCPNRDGTLSFDGCSYCNNDSFSPFYTSNACSIIEQLEKGASFYAKRYNCRRFWAYFQSFSNTYSDVQNLHTKYSQALSLPFIEGLIIATRPDCINDSVVDLLKTFNKLTYIRVELGAESFDDDVLSAINRHHDVNAVFKAVKILKEAEIETCVHLIFGLPLEKKDSPKTSAEIVSELGVRFVKLHHLQIVKGSLLEQAYKNGSFNGKLHTAESYLDVLCEFLTFLDEGVYIERLINRAPLNYLLAPIWGNVTESSFKEMLLKR
ncbi:MAG: TIGR01212 family radical SAM protein [Candidatus Riflebacteria bacterium]|nr:TIGR01212 family radical SAM protein [Candidatus Riflebacteria bacterium]